MSVKKGKKTGYEVVIVADASMRTVKNMYGGANKKNRDLLNINIDRDWKPDIEGDVALAQPGMFSREGGELVEKRGIEVGNIFQLGYHYTNLMHDAEYTDEQGKRQKYYMGCYGIGIGRTMAAIVEAFHDDKGIAWPEDVAPYRVYLASIGASDATLKEADELYSLLTVKGVPVLYDNRDVRAGEKFADADLIGIPHRVVMSDKTAAAGTYEYKARTSDTAQQLSKDDLLKLLGV